MKENTNVQTQYLIFIGYICEYEIWYVKHIMNIGYLHIV